MGSVDYVPLRVRFCTVLNGLGRPFGPPLWSTELEPRYVTGWRERCKRRTHETGKGLIG